MSVSTLTNKVSYTARGVTYAYTFKIFDDSELKVYNAGVLQALTTDYTVTGAGDATGGSVVFNSAPTAGNIILILRELPYTQLVELVLNAEEPSTSIEETADRATMLIQQLKEVSDRSLKVSVNSTIATLEVPELASGYLRWNAGLTALEAVAVVSVGTVTFSSFGTSWVNLANAAAGRATLGVFTGGGGDDYAAATGTTTTWAATVSSAITVLTTGLEVKIKAPSTITGALTLDLNALGAKSVRKYNSSGLVALIANDIMSGQTVELVYDGTYWILVGGGIEYARLDVANTLNGNQVIVTGQVTLDNNKPYLGKTTAAVARNLAKVNASNQVNLGDAALETIVYSSTYTNFPEGISLSNGKYLAGLNTTGAPIALARISGTNVLEYGNAGYAANIIASAANIIASSLTFNGNQVAALVGGTLTANLTGTASNASALNTHADTYFATAASVPKIHGGTFSTDGSGVAVVDLTSYFATVTSFIISHGKDGTPISDQGEDAVNADVAMNRDASGAFNGKVYVRNASLATVIQLRAPSGLLILYAGHSGWTLAVV